MAEQIGPVERGAHKRLCDAGILIAEVEAGELVVLRDLQGADDHRADQHQCARPDHRERRDITTPTTYRLPQCLQQPPGSDDHRHHHQPRRVGGCGTGDREHSREHAATITDRTDHEHRGDRRQGDADRVGDCREREFHVGQRRENGRDRGGKSCEDRAPVRIESLAAQPICERPDTDRQGERQRCRGEDVVQLHGVGTGQRVEQSAQVVPRVRVVVESVRVVVHQLAHVERRPVAGLMDPLQSIGMPQGVPHLRDVVQSEECGADQSPDRRQDDDQRAQQHTGGNGQQGRATDRAYLGGDRRGQGPESPGSEVPPPRHQPGHSDHHGSRPDVPRDGQRPVEHGEDADHAECERCTRGDRHRPRQ